MNQRNSGDSIIVPRRAARPGRFGGRKIFASPLRNAVAMGYAIRKFLEKNSTVDRVIKTE
jgi:hypothetical protein